MDHDPQANELRVALDGLPGQLDAYLETRDEAELKADIRALIGEVGGKERRLFAAMAMQGLACRDIRVGDGEPATLAARAVSYADALLSALKEVQP